MQVYELEFTIMFPAPIAVFVAMIGVTMVLCVVWIYKWFNSLVTGSGGS